MKEVIRLFSKAIEDMNATKATKDAKAAKAGTEATWFINLYHSKIYAYAKEDEICSLLKSLIATHKKCNNTYRGNNAYIKCPIAWN